MERRQKMKGTVTPLSSVLPPEEARKAAVKVEEAIAGKEIELSHLNRFVADNANLIKLIKHLPDELHHDIMVPFGKAAFFPGRLIHTNEFLVLLGEGYHAERTSKQTVDILKRRGKALDSQVDAFKSVIKDLRLEASFFNSTAAEGEEGLLEIREEYIEEDPEENTLETGLEKPDKPSTRPQSITNVAGDDEENARVKARMDEPRDEQKYAHIDDTEYAKMMARLEELEREEEEEAAAIDADSDSEDEELAQRISGLSDWVSEDQIYNCQEKVNEKLKVGSSGLQSSVNGESPSKKDLLHSVKERSAETHAVASDVNMGIQTAPKSNYKVSTEASKPDTGSRISRSITDNQKVSTETSNKPDTGSRNPRPITDSQKAFSGSIIERADNLPTNPSQATPSQPSSTQSSKPVSRFKMQRR